KPLDVAGQPPYPVCTKHLSQPAQPGGGPTPAWDTGPQASEAIETSTLRALPTRVGSPEGRTSPFWCSFLHFSQEKWSPPASTPLCRLAPRSVSPPTTRRVRTSGR